MTKRREQTEPKITWWVYRALNDSSEGPALDLSQCVDRDHVDAVLTFQGISWIGLGVKRRNKAFMIRDASWSRWEETPRFELMPVDQDALKQIAQLKWKK